jgi:hypothetical protein
MDWNSTGTQLIGVDDIQDISEIRFGADLILPIKAGTLRFKCGAVWVNNSINSSYWKTIINSSKVLFRFEIQG